MMTENPYAPPQAPLGCIVPQTEEEKIRRYYLNREAAVQSIGFFYCLVAIFAIVLGVISTICLLEDLDVASLAIAVLILGGGRFLFFVGQGIRLLQPWSRLPAIGIFLIVPSLFLAYGIYPGAAVAAVLIAYIILMLYGKKGNMVFSEDYRKIIIATRHIKYRKTIRGWVLIFLLLILLSVPFLAVILK